MLTCHLLYEFVFLPPFRPGRSQPNSVAKKTHSRFFSMESLIYVAGISFRKLAAGSQRAVANLVVLVWLLKPLSWETTCSIVLNTTQEVCLS
ncbi:hypothetical protein TNCV_966001 [Trichonephila clavipes]|nr:hypothetical protein TNCV_966001 [Trichonephila clavipes]